MNAAPTVAPVAMPLARRARAATPAEQLAAQDLRALAWLHAAERDSATWLALHRNGFPQGLALLTAADDAVVAMDAALTALGHTPASERRQLDAELAADYAGIYLTHALRASPYESVWLDDDNLMLQAPTFDVRTIYRQHGMVVIDWRTMPDDHLSHELAFCAHALALGQPEAARQFASEHLLRWLPRFAERVHRRAGTLLYAALAMLTLHAVQALHRPAA
ncbi:MAG: molecular chaperone TorD family protein [Proteobacteria bacterium]|nr:molecular chaperone TorD family protein [Pseudomonadota bacterium]